MKPTRFASLLSAVALSAVVAFPALAQDAKSKDTHLEAAIAVVKQTGTIPSEASQLNQIGITAKNVLIRQKPDAEDDIIEVVDSVIKEQEGVEGGLENAIAQVWASYFKEDELKEILAFFQTEAGQKFASYNPRVIGESVAALRQYNGQVTLEVSRKAMEGLNAKGHKFK